MEYELLKKTLVRLRRDELEKTLKKWSKLSKHHPAWGCLEGLDLSTTKIQLLPQLYKRLSKIQPHHAGELDLLYMLQHSSSKTWTVWLSTELHGSEGYAETPQAFRRRLKTALESYFMLDIQVMEHQKALWVRIYIHEDTKYQANNTVYAVYYPHSPVLILTAIKAANREYIIQAFSNTLSAGELEEQMLSGHCLSSLAQLSLNKYSQGYFSHYRLGQVDINALARGEKRKRKIEEEEEVLDERITYENIKDKQRSKKILQDTFGSNEQPSLERLEYKMETNFRGGNCAPHFAKNKEPFRCRVKFEGRNVLEGIKNLGKAGYATLPLPAHLARVPSLAKNTIILGNKKSKRQ